MKPTFGDYPPEFNDIKHLFWPPGGLRSAVQSQSRQHRAGARRGRAHEESIIIYPPTIDWHFMKQRPQHIMQRFASNGHRVYYCNKTQSKNHDLEVVSPNLTIVHNNKTFIQEIIPKLKTEGKSILLWVSWSKLHPFLDQYQPDFVVYDHVDDFPVWEPYLQAMVERTNVISTTAGILKQQIERAYPHKPSYLIPNGCNISRFKQRDDHPATPRPVEYRNHYGPIITYVGAWADWVDQVLVTKIATTFPEALVSVIGVEFGATVDRSIPNLKYLGYKFHEFLPLYLYHSDVCLIPFKLNRITLATNPIKMYEFLAAGKPVVSTDLPEVSNVPGVYVGKDHASFLYLIDRLLSGSIRFPQESVEEWLAEQTWDRRYEDIVQMLTDTWR